MSRKIAFYETEYQVIQAIQQLEQAGFVPGELQVIAKDWDHSRRLEAETDVHVDELQDIVDANAGRSSSDDGIPGLPATPILLAGFGGVNWSNGISAPAVFPSAFAYSDDEYERALRAFNLDDQETQACLDAVTKGLIAVLVETDDQMTFIDKEDGADLSRLSTAEGVFRNSGALSIVSGK